MKKLLLTASVLSIFTVSAWGRTLSPEEALRRVSPESRSSLAVEQLVDTRQMLGQPVYYVFKSADEGFMILSADDCGAPLLGYSDKGVYDPANIPPSLQFMLDCYAEEIAKASTADGVNHVAPAAPAPPKSSIAPLLSCRWNQDSPYNDECPMDGSERSVTGCTATALAQVMYYHKWPEKGSGSISYHCSLGDMSMDFSQYTFDWSNMLDSYSADATKAQKKAVADLMTAVGYSVRMNYGSDASGAFLQYAAEGLYRYFGYDKGLSVYYRDLYPIAEWEEMIYNNLRDCGPVVYSGYNKPLDNKVAGHTFVCDGYDSKTGLFHINWGWGGMSDGYFALTGLDPDSQGIGGSSSGYNYQQLILSNIRKPAGNVEQTPLIGSVEPLKVSGTGGLSFKIGNVGMISGNEKIEALVAARIVSETGEETMRKLTSPMTFTNEIFWATYSLNMSLSGLSDGTYKIYLVYSLDNGATWIEMLYPIGTARYAVGVKEGNNAEFFIPETGRLNIEINDVTPLYTGSNFWADVEVSNNNDFEIYQSVQAVFYKDGEEKSRCEYMLVDLPSGQSKAYEYGGVVPSALAEGDYDLVMENEYGVVLSDKFPVHVNAAAKSEISLVSQMVVTSLGVGPSNYPKVNPQDVVLRFNVKNISGFYAGNLTVYVWDMNNTGAGVLGILTSDRIMLKEGESSWVTISGAVDNTVPGQVLLFQLVDLASNTELNVGNYLYALVDPAGGIGDIESDVPVITVDRQSGTVTVEASGISAVDVFAMSGARAAVTSEITSDRAVVNTSSLARGVYLVKVTSASGVITEKFVK